MKRIFFYIIVPVYNVEKSIHDCIQSVLNQTYTQWQMLLIDDGSEDQSNVICDEYADMYDNITVIHQKNKGLFATRQVGIQHMLDECQGKKYEVYMISLDSDDTLKPYALEKINESILKYECDMVVYDYDRIEDGKIDRSYGGRNHFSGMVRDKRSLYRMTCMVRAYSNVCTKAVSLSVMMDERQYTDVGIAWGEDTIQSLDYWRNANSVYFLDEPLYNYMANPESITASGVCDFYSDELLVNEIIYDFLEKENVLSNEDWAMYKKWCINHVVGVVMQICCTKKRVIAIFSILEAIRHSSYYMAKIESSNVCAIDGKRKWIAYWFEKKQYGIIYALVRLHACAEKLRGR